MDTYRQGDVLLVKIKKLPNNIKEKSKILAFGEITGHRHRFLSKQVQVFKDDTDEQFVLIKKSAKLIHEEHSELDIPKGVYSVVIQREFDILKTFSKVLD